MEKKFIVCEKMESNDEEGTIVGWGSRPTKDRDKELIVSSAWKLDNYRKNPVLMLCHDYNQPPIGKCYWVKADANGLKFKAKFANTERGKEVYQLYKDGIMSAFSVGFSPNPGGVVDNPTEKQYKGLKRLFTDVELLEISCVPIPANSGALVDYVKAGKIHTKQLKEELDVILNIIEDKDDVIDIKNFIPEDIKNEDLDKLIVKSIDSFSDITNAINHMLNKIEPALTEEELKDYSRNRYVNDIYPVDFPNGYVIYSESKRVEPCKYYKINYTYNLDTKEAIFSGVPVEVEQSWAEKSYGQPDTVKENGGFIIKLFSTVVTKIEETDNFIHIPSPGEEGNHKDHKIRTMMLSKKEGIQGKYCVDDKVMIGYMFNKDNDWDKEKAIKWVEDHKKSFEIESSDEDIDNIVFKGITWDEDGDIKFIDRNIKAMSPEDDEDMAMFMERCMADEKMSNDNPEDEDRKSACQMMWDNKSSKKDMKNIDDKLSDEEIIKTLEEQLTVLKSSVEKIGTTEVAPASIQTESIIKTVDSKGNPSLYDLTNAISNALNDLQNAMTVNSDNDQGCYFQVVDIYATEYPNGHVVYSKYYKNKCEFYQIDYTFDITEKEVTLVGEPILVLQSWVEDKYGRQEMTIKSEDEDEIVTKEGRVLSDTNRQLLMNCMMQMKEAIDAVNALITATNPSAKPITAITVEDLFKEENDIIIKDEEELEIIEKNIDEGNEEFEVESNELEVDEDLIKDAISNAMTKISKGIDVKGIVAEGMAKRLGRVIL